MGKNQEFSENILNSSKVDKESAGRVGLQVVGEVLEGGNQFPYIYERAEGTRIMLGSPP